MSTKFTPGPWVVNADLTQDWSIDCDNDIGSYWNSISSATQEAPISFVVHDNWRDDETVEANTQLIAAAPELYTALEAFVNFKSDGTTSVTDDDQLWLKAEQALAKARGE